ncbi:hypothetical protein [Bacillus sp. B-jedd]|uniref:hypothetical protein n=1 Tax=Bacillus sp. B-jedd TaxID=1476857 RepID=UPI0005156AC6|nr:hypothetical protein [Bacillus sp. B-jedd]CEG25676.1 hypothetical protein BN1002_00492 [Bacillus sp. B-jedd]
MILRHITLSINIPSILEDGYLKPANKPGCMDHDCVSFEVYNGSNAFIKCCMHEEGLDEEDIVPLYFDSNKMNEDGYYPVEKVYEKAYSKKELEVNIKKEVFHKEFGMISIGIITQEEYDSIGEYRFVKGKVPLKYLTEESKQRLGIRDSK